MSLQHYNTMTLMGVLRVQRPLDTYWLNLCFPQQMTFDTESISFDKVVTTRKLAPFVAPTHQGKVQKRNGYTAKSFTPAYVKPKDEVDPSRVLQRMAGEQLMGSLTPEQRWNAAVADRLRLQKEEITRRWEWMGARAVIDGSVTVSGDDYPTTNVDFGRDTDNTFTLSGGALWSAGTGVDRLGVIEAVRRQVQKAAKSAVTRLTFGLDAWAAFTENPAVLDLLSNQKRGSDSNFNVNLGEGQPYEYRGYLSGQGTGTLELFTYSDTYETDNAGTEADFLNSGYVVATSPGIQGVRAFGAIKDRSSLVATPMFPKMWDNDDPSVTYIMTQSAPLMIPTQPDASAVIQPL
jgi:surface antigen